jgi:hypothetical protein
MNDQEQKHIISLLQEIRDLLVPVSVCHEERYAEIQQMRLEEKVKLFESIMSPVRWRIFPLLFDPTRPSQAQIAERVGTTQPTISRFVTVLL